MTPGSNPPVQARSREKLERILGAVEELLCEHLFEDITMSRIAQQAGVAVGTIYTRFGSKNEMLPVLFSRHDAKVQGRVGGLLRRTAQEPTLKARVGGIVSFAVDYHVKHRGLLRALTMHVRANPEGIPLQAWKDRENQYRAVANVLVGNGRGIQRSPALEAAEFCLGVVNSVCREQVLFSDVTPLRGKRPSVTFLKKRLCEMLLRDLSS